MYHEAYTLHIGGGWDSSYMSSTSRRVKAQLVEEDVIMMEEPATATVAETNPGPTLVDWSEEKKNEPERKSRKAKRKVKQGELWQLPPSVVITLEGITDVFIRKSRIFN